MGTRRSAAKLLNKVAPTPNGMISLFELYLTSEKGQPLYTTKAILLALNLAPVWRTTHSHFWVWCSVPVASQTAASCSSQTSEKDLTVSQEITRQNKNSFVKYWWWFSMSIKQTSQIGSEDTSFNIELELSMILLLWSRRHCFYWKFSVCKYTHTSVMQPSRHSFRPCLTYTATGVLGTTLMSPWRSLKKVLTKHRNVRAPRTEIENAATAFKRVRAEYMLLSSSLWVGFIWNSYTWLPRPFHQFCNEKLMQKLMSL